MGQIQHLCPRMMQPLLDNPQMPLPTVFIDYSETISSPESGAKVKSPLDQKGLVSENKCCL